VFPKRFFYDAPAGAIVPQRFESIDSIVRRFNKVVDDNGRVPIEFREKRRFVPKSERRRQKSRRARARRQS